MKASVIICAHTEQRWQNLLDAVASVRAQSHPAHEIVVVIDHNDALCERAAAQIDRVRVLPNGDVRGLGGARNTGVEHATGDVVVFLDDDAVASSGWLACFAEAYRDERVLGAGGAVVPDWERPRPRWYPVEFDWTIGCSWTGLPQRTAPVRNLIGCNMSYRREAVESAGRFRLGYGCDETEFCIRLSVLRPESELLYVPEATVRHHVPASRGTLRHFVTRCWFEGGSKAVVSRLAGSARGLKSERAYVVAVLPAGVLRGIADTVTGRDRAGVLRSAAIVLGVSATAAGFVAGRVGIQRAAERRGWVGESLSRRRLTPAARAL